MYDSLVEAGQAQRFLRVNAWMSGLSQTAAALCCLLADGVLRLGFVRAYGLGAMLGACVAALTLALHEPLVTQAQRVRAQRPFAGLGPRLRAHVRASVRFLRTDKRSACRILADVGTAVPIYLTFMFLQQHLGEAGLPAPLLGAALLAVRLAGTAGVAAAAWVKKPLFTVFKFCAAAAAVGTMLAGMHLWPCVLAGAMAAELASCMLQLRVSVRLNEVFPSDQRATLISVQSMLYSMVMIFVSPAVGAVADKAGVSPALFGLGAALAMCALAGGALYTRAFRKGKRVGAQR